MTRIRKPGRKKTPRGFKLHQRAELEKEVIRWVEGNPKISNKEVSERLKDEFKFNFSGPSVRDWKKNYYSKVDEKVKEKLKTQSVKDGNLIDELTFSRKAYILELKSSRADVDKRIKIIEGEQATIEKEYKESLKLAQQEAAKSNKDKSKEKKLEIKYSPLMLSLERQYANYIKLRTYINDIILDHLGPPDVYDKLEKAIKMATRSTADVMKTYLKKDSDMEELQKELVKRTDSLLKDLKEEFSVL